jgi:hypothetical protein
MFVSHDKTGQRMVHLRVFMVTTIKLSLLFFIATLPAWLANHRVLTSLGLLVSVFFALSRAIDWGVETDHHGVKKLIHAVNIATQISNLKNMSIIAVPRTGSPLGGSMQQRNTE